MQDIEWGKIKWQSRRGMRELDLMLLPFVEHDLPNMDEAAVDAYIDLFKATDLELFRWLHGSAEPDSKSRKDMIATIIKCHEGRKGREGV